MLVTVDRSACVGAGTCALLAGAVFDQDDDGIVELLVAEPSGPDAAAALKAASLCPARAILVED